MSIHSLDRWQHPHQYYSPDARNERNTRWVVFLTVSMMLAEIAAGSLFGSMALMADGWHMGTHAAALGITLIAYFYARRLANDRRFTFGTGKMGALGGFSSAVVLLVVALLMGFEGLQRLVRPHPIQYNEAMIVAGIGLSVNLFSALLLRGEDHHHDHDHAHHHHSDTDDHNLKAAYLHVLADALTSVLAIVALLAGKIFGWVWMDAMMGMVGAAVIMRWSLGLLRETGGILLDQSADEQIIQEIQQRLEKDGDNRLADLHIWRISSTHYAGIISLVTHCPKPSDYYRTLLGQLDELAHVTIEVNHCQCETCTLAEPSPAD